ncbi:hypothetical protein L2E82_26359 [Cichorium intybus]|uniref:Uncharacterized protein n=1 Tax=Cichorium intybus TaxID=13427 RepID=A0ACB9CQI7_CICIN|nr:hypothetical protein L2E82_26359 [Cichorium intybus]
MLVKIMTKGEGRRDRRRFLKSREVINGGSQPPELVPVPSDDGLGVSHRWVRKDKKDRHRGGILVEAPHLLDLLMVGSLLTDLISRHSRPSHASPAYKLIFCREGQEGKAGVTKCLTD